MSPRLRSSLACALWCLLGCGGPPAVEAPGQRTGGAESAEAAPALLAEPWARWTADPAYADVSLPFVMGIVQRPCDALYSVQGEPRMEVRYTYEARRIRIDVLPGELVGEGHAFCLPNPPFLAAALELNPIVWTWELDERGRVVARTLEDESGVLSRVRYVWEGDRWSGVALDDGQAQPVSWNGELIASVPRPGAGRTTFSFDGEARLVERRTEAPDGALTLWQYVHEEHSPRLVASSFAEYPDPDGDPSVERRAAFELDDEGRPLSCTLEDSEEGEVTVRYAYDGQGRLLERRASVDDEEAWSWSYRYDCSAPRPDESAEE